ncbi:hypothetical protein BN946_scf184915.g36 [Trametes cinnabarina]|uniref:Uncharacterized protein n=1 Tax=Pycnoporus cinnabarinus TaxID=5643 RepID=A0A060SB24_PYCCI|nr:hypothetical protein BN946_scf184915.g36 [Trametes cinnabarina]
MFAGKGCKSIYKTFSVLDHVVPHKCVEADPDLPDLTLRSAILYQGKDVGLFVPVFVGDKCGGKFWQVSDINKCLDTPVPYTVFKVD